MKRRLVLGVAACGAMLALTAVALQERPGLLLLEWAAKAKAETPPVAILIEMGLKDTEPRDWSGRAIVQGAKVVHREGYRFRDTDKLIDPDGWQASSHRPIRLPKGNPALARTEGIATVGVVLHLANLQPEATLAVHLKDQKVPPKPIPLKDLLTGIPHQTEDGVVCRRITTATPIAVGKTEDDFPAAAYGPDGTLWVAYISYHIKEDSRRIEAPQLKEQPANFKAYHTPEFGDQLFVQYYRNGRWSKPAAVTGANEDLVRCAVAVDKDNNTWVAYSANRNGNYDIYARRMDLNTPEATSHPTPRMDPEMRLTDNPGPDLGPVMCTDHEGDVRLTCQCWSTDNDGFTVYYPPAYHSKGKWSKLGARLNIHCWHPALASGPATLALVHDKYQGGDYDISAAYSKPGGAVTIGGVIASSRFEARPSVCYDAKGRLWIAYEEGPVKWGKDYGAFDDDDGNPLYNDRSVRVVCLDNGKLMRPAAELPTSKVETPKMPYGGQAGPRFERAERYAYPKLGLDGKGRLWLTYRVKFGTRYSSHPGSYWLTFARRLDGDRWTEPIEVHHSCGLLDHRPVLLPHAGGGLVIIHNTDGRYTTPETIDNQIYLSYIDLPGEPVEPKLVPHDPGKKDPKLVKQAEEERAAVQRIRTYRVTAGGKTYQLLRGEFHRHTEMSWDGGPDGSLEDMFRYAIDCAALDWIGNGDHDNGAGREYPWWLTQKLTDAYHVANVFTPMFTYERSVPYPHGHRNVMFAKRGVRTLPRLAEPDETKRVAGIHADDTKMLYRYLKELDGICASHTSATNMGTDWRDNDPVAEPIVEIYQGDRMSYEYPGCPRAGYDPKSGKHPPQIGGWQPAGFLDNALLKKGYRLGFQASSDHWSTHISYCIVLAEKRDRQAILDALKQRHCYGATDDIIVDVRSGPHVMGDEFKTDRPPALEITVIGTKPLERIDIVKDSAVVATLKPEGPTYKGTWTDPKPTAGTHYYYIRVHQIDEELAWSSPLWIEFGKP
jgi:hypothetical protein